MKDSEERSDEESGAGTLLGSLDPPPQTPRFTPGDIFQVTFEASPKGGARRDFGDPPGSVGAIRPDASGPPLQGRPVGPRPAPGAAGTSDRRAALWEVGLRYHPPKSGPPKSGPQKSGAGGRQLALGLPVEQDMAELPPQSGWEVMLDEYRTMGLHPAGHLMAMLRPHLPQAVRSSRELLELADGTEVTVAGLAIRRQRPLGKTVFVTLEDEFGHIPLVIWPKVYERYRLVLREPVLMVKGEVSRREGTMNIAVKHVARARGARHLPKAKNWG